MLLDFNAGSGGGVGGSGLLCTAPKGRGGAGVAFHPFVGGEGILLSASVSPTGFVRNGRAVRAEKRAKSSVKGTGLDVSPAGQ